MSINARRNRVGGWRRPGGMRRLGLGVCALLLVAGCGQAPTAQPGGGGSGEDLVGRTFLSTSATDGGEPLGLAGGTRVSLWFADDGRLVANAGCNTLAGPVTLDGGKIETTGGLSMTEMGCDAPLHAQDEWLAKLLQASPSWRLDGDELVVTGANSELVLLDRSVAEPDQPVEGTRWQLDTIFSAGTASSVPAGADAHLTFAGGRVTGSTGCNTLEGPAAITGSTIKFGQLSMTRKACPDDLATMERAMVAVLQGDVPFEIESDQLTLNPGVGQSLGFRA